MMLTHDDVSCVCNTINYFLNVKQAVLAIKRNFAKRGISLKPVTSIDCSVQFLNLHDAFLVTSTSITFQFILLLAMSDDQRKVRLFFLKYLFYIMIAVL